MKSFLRKLQILSLAVLLGLETSTLIPNFPLNPSNQETYILSEYDHGDYFHSWQSQETQNDTSTSVSLPANTQQSGNWGGYIVTSKSANEYTSISGSWTVPNITSSQSNALAGQWIGLGGVSTTDLLQIGTIEQLENGQPVAELFWEKLPDVAQTIVTVPIGSTINASISKADSSGLAWNLTFTATTSSGETQSQTISVTLDSTYAQEIGTSAEWISEDPSYTDGRLYPLANMGTVTYSSALANGLALNSSENAVIPVAMVSNNNILIAPSTLGTDGESFSTTVITSNSSSSSSRTGHYRYPSKRQSGMSNGWSGHEGFSGW